MIRRGRPGDAEAIAQLQQRAWLRAYADFLDIHDILAWDMDARAEGWRARLTESPAATWVFEVDGNVVGFAAAGPSDEGEKVGCLWAMYVEPAAQGAGVGGALLDHVELELTQAGYRTAVLWVFSANEHGRRFYERHGWAFEEGSETVGANWSAPAVRYRKELG